MSSHRSPTQDGQLSKPSGISNRLPSLDGLRAVSILLVLLGHLSGTRGFGRITLGVGDYAHLGVLVFFVISGFLITRLMLSEYQRQGRVSLGNFYLRRVLRLFPASYAYILVVSLASAAGLFALNSSDIWHAVTYTVNYLPSRSWQIGHLWSLSVEEQFYLLWPCAFALSKPRRAAWVAAGVILFGPVARALTWLFLRHTPYYDLETFPTLADSLAMGCLLAMLSGWLERQRWYLRLFRPHYSLCLLALILLINRYGGYTIVAVFGTSIVYAATAILVHRSLYCSNDWVGRLLNWRPITFLGVLSYSLYVWQQLFLNRTSSSWVNEFPQNILFAFAAALCSYFLLEKPFLSLRRRLRLVA
ncbi:MAG: acyltransferase [Terracidiphilus sp.]